QDCCVCRKSRAGITCWETGCERSFHLPCATQGECITQYHPLYRYLLSASCHHCQGRTQHFSPHPSLPLSHQGILLAAPPREVVEAAPEKGTTCLICLDKVEDRKSSPTLVCLACKHAWFHRSCIQGQALCDSFSRFQCPLCRERDRFQGEMQRGWVHIPSR
ncbi:G2E3 ligase, partial [Halcyon senegalensis]|nr:G2E3 ligase [Halcyon senegalensis]